LVGRSAERHVDKILFTIVGSRKFLELVSNKRGKRKTIPVQVWTDPEGSRR
jgi:hypothetical protein